MELVVKFLTSLFGAYLVKGGGRNQGLSAFKLQKCLLKQRIM